MKLKTALILKEKISKIDDVDFVIQGGFSLWLSKEISRVPKDLDVLFFNSKNNDVFQNTKKWEKFISNFEITNKKIDTVFFKKYKIMIIMKK